MKALWRRLRGSRRKPPPWGRPSPELERFALRLPKVELHLPLESSLRPATVLTLAQAAGLDLGVQSEAELRGKLVPRDPAARRTVRRRFRTLLADPEGLDLALRDVVAEAAIQNILHVEVVVPFGSLLADGLDPDAVRRVLAARREEAAGRDVDLAFLLGLDAATAEERELVFAAGADGFAALVLEDAEELAPTDLERLVGLHGRRVLVGTPGRGRTDLVATVGPERLVHAGGAALADPDPSGGGAGAPLPIRLRCPAADRLLGVESPDQGPVATAGGPLLATNLTREMLRAVDGAEARGADPRLELVDAVRAAIGAAFAGEDARRSWAERLAAAAG